MITYPTFLAVIEMQQHCRSTRISDLSTGNALQHYLRRSYDNAGLFEHAAPNRGVIVASIKLRNDASHRDSLRASPGRADVKWDFNQIASVASLNRNYFAHLPFSIIWGAAEIHPPRQSTAFANPPF
jgi:hypothetical protein